MIDNWI